MPIKITPSASARPVYPFSRLFDRPHIGKLFNPVSQDQAATPIENQSLMALDSDHFLLFLSDGSAPVLMPRNGGFNWVNRQYVVATTSVTLSN